MNITRGKISKAQKVVIYGPEGIGKSTFAASFPDPIFIDTEGSTNNLDVARMDKPTSWSMLKAQIEYIGQNRPCRTLIIDTIDWAEQLCISEVCAAHDKKGIEDFGYGNGYVYEKEEFGRLLNRLSDLTDIGINVVLTAHAQLRKFSQPDEFGEYDRWELKLGKKTGSQISPLVKEWADMVLFANYKTVAVAADKDGNKFKAQGGGRVMYTQHHPCWDAKNRHGLEDGLPFEYAVIAHIFSRPTTQPPVQQTAPAEPSQAVEKTTAKQTAENPLDTGSAPENIVIPQGTAKPLADLMRANSVSEEEIRLAVANKHYYPYETPITNYDPNFINGCLVAAWDSVYKLICNNRDLPFE